jgi:tetratricopeptide (TPR) repeat protein
VNASTRFNPNYAAAHNNLGLALANSGGRWPEAIAEYEAALRIRPDPKLRQIVNQLRAGRK